MMSVNELSKKQCQSIIVNQLETSNIEDLIEQHQLTIEVNDLDEHLTTKNTSIEDGAWWSKNRFKSESDRVFWRSSDKSLHCFTAYSHDREHSIWKCILTFQFGFDYDFNSLMN